MDLGASGDGTAVRMSGRNRNESIRAIITFKMELEGPDGLPNHRSD